MTEHTLAVTFPPIDRAPRVDAVNADTLSSSRLAVPHANGEATRVELVSCGRPFPGHEVRIADPKGRPLPERTVGQTPSRDRRRSADTSIARRGRGKRWPAAGCTRATSDTSPTASCTCAVG